MSGVVVEILDCHCRFITTQKPNYSDGKDRNFCLMAPTRSRSVGVVSVVLLWLHGKHASITRPRHDAGATTQRKGLPWN